LSDRIEAYEGGREERGKKIAERKSRIVVKTPVSCPISLRYTPSEDNNQPSPSENKHSGTMSIGASSTVHGIA
jgi:hypothetical protein